MAITSEIKLNIISGYTVNYYLDLSPVTNPDLFEIRVELLVSKKKNSQGIHPVTKVFIEPERVKQLIISSN